MDKKYLWSILALFLVGWFRIGTQSDPSSQQIAHGSSSLTGATAISITPTPEIAPLIGYTHHRADGNRFVSGRGSLPDTTPIDIPLNGTPEWVIALPDGDASLWAVVLEDGSVQAFRVDAQGAVPTSIAPTQLTPGMPPTAEFSDQTLSLVTSSSTDQSQSTHPIHLENGMQIYILLDGSLMFVERDGSTTSLAIDALPDARILSDENGNLLLLSGPTNQYTHGVLGDQYEATEITLIETRPEVRVVNQITVPNGQVIEGIAPIWTDLNGDGSREIIVTFSDAIQGAQLAVYDQNGEILARSQAIGQGYRWRHQIAVAPFGPQGEWELVDVLTPHLGGVVEFFQWKGTSLKKVASLAGYTSHVIGSRNLDMAVAGDFDGDGQVELLLPTQDLTKLGSIHRTTDHADVAWEVLIGGKVSTNIGATTVKSDEIAVGVGRSDDVLRVWFPNTP